VAELSRFWGIVIAVFFRGETGRHNRPHVHVSTAEYAAVVAIDDGKILAGSLPIPVRRVVREFVRLRRVELLTAWDEAQSGRRPTKVAPLKVR
jgi:hypothetical protein